MKRITLALSIVLSQYGLSQAPHSSNSTSSGPCSISHSGDGDVFIIKQCGIGEVQGEKILSLLRKIASEKDTAALNLKLDRLLQVASQPLQSQANTGGVNVNQGTYGANSPIIGSPITIGDLRGTIPTASVPRVKAILMSAPIKPPIVVGANQISAAYPFPNDFYNVLRDSGWTMPSPGVGESMDFKYAGQRAPKAVITISGNTPQDGEPKSVSAPDPVYYICSALDLFKIPCELRHTKQWSNSVINIWFEDGFPKVDQ